MSFSWAALKDLGILIPFLIYALLTAAFLGQLAKLLFKKSSVNDEELVKSLLVASALAYGVYFAYLLHPYVGLSLAALFVGTGLWGLKDFQPLGKNFTLLLVTGVFYILLYHIPYPVLATSELDRVRVLYNLPLDNQLPEYFAELLRKGLDLRVEAQDWRSSDRPPLQSALYLSFSFFKSTAIYQAFAMILNLLWIPATAFWLKKMSFSPLYQRRFFLLAPLIGFFYLHSIFVWPKMLSAAFFILSLAFIADLRWSILALALSFLAHSGSVFAAPLWLVMAYPQWTRKEFFSWGNIRGFLPSFLLVGTWLGYQKFYDPPGDRLAKMHLAGVDTLEKISLSTALAEAYSKLSFAQWYQLKLSNFEVIFKIFPDEWTLRSWRTFEFFSSIGSLSLGGMLGLGLFLYHFAGASQPLRKLTLGIGLSWVLWALVLLGPRSTVVHQGALVLNIALFALAVAGLTQLSQRHFLYLLLLQIYVLLGPWTLSNWFPQVERVQGINFWTCLLLVAFLLVLWKRLSYKSPNVG